MDALSPGHLLVIAAIAAVVLGPEKIPEIMGQLGRGIRALNEARTALWDAAGGSPTGVGGWLMTGQGLQAPASEPVPSSTSPIPVPQAPLRTPVPSVLAASPSHAFVARDGAPLSPPY